MTLYYTYQNYLNMMKMCGIVQMGRFYVRERVYENIFLGIGGSGGYWVWFVCCLYYSYVEDTLIWMCWVCGMIWGMQKGFCFRYGQGLCIGVSVGLMPNLSEVLLQGISKKLDKLLDLMKELIKVLGKKINKDGVKEKE